MNDEILMDILKPEDQDAILQYKFALFPCSRVTGCHQLNFQQHK